ncbi:Argonaute complex, subunit Arb1 [Thelonectria olida]|uniref:Argonaute complex, subunit Arb1 n=1 Tax=Thelonectria olida TaxID=1576542 RepID=A0A9P8WD91_9HYPO|nr:Argonaute complex, subunit Arb1 [Thelonectria olida]
MEAPGAQDLPVQGTDYLDAIAKNDGQAQGSLPFHELPTSLQGVAKPSKKKRGKRTVASRGETALPKNRGNGFEEYFADPPMTPEEARQEKAEIYSPRMQSCIQRYRSRRRLQGDRNLWFSEFLFLGGVDTNPAAYGGLGPQDLRDLTPAQRREATATDIIYGTTAAGDRFYNGDKGAWDVDFAGVAAGFFSVTLLHLTSFEPALMEEGIDVVENFLRYVLHHDVCNEYKDNIKAAIVVCDVARKEWPMLRRIYASLPGQFNLAAGELFRPDEAAGSWSFQQTGRPKGFNAKAVFYSSFALMDEPELFSRLCEKTPTVINEFSCTVELVGISRPQQDVVDRFKLLVIEDDTQQHAPIGKATFKPAIIEDNWVRPNVAWPIEEDTMTLFIDDSLLEDMSIGMKGRLMICELDVGLRFVGAVEAIFPSFYTFLPQELMRHYKPPRESDRPAPSVNDPDMEDKQHANEAKA